MLYAIGNHRYCKVSISLLLMPLICTPFCTKSFQCFVVALMHMTVVCECTSTCEVVVTVGVTYLACVQYYVHMCDTIWLVLSVP